MATVMSAWNRGIFIILQLICVVFAQDKEVDTGTALPESSADFLESFSCNDLDLNFEQDDSFFRWVLSGRHTTWQPGWVLSMKGDDKYYARVYDMLNWARGENLLPVAVNVSSICHKGMETQYINGIDQIEHSNVIPPTPNQYMPTEIWSNLWNTCQKQLLSTRQSCIDIPGFLVSNPVPPWNVNNPCHLEYRMVDGAHRICLRKYLLALLLGELAELEEAEKLVGGDTCNSSGDSIYDQMQEKQILINQTTYGLYLVMNHTTFQSMLMSSDPHASWAKSKQHLMRDMTHDLKSDWGKWMGWVMDRVRMSKEQSPE